MSHTQPQFLQSPLPGQPMLPSLAEELAMLQQLPLQLPERLPLLEQPMLVGQRLRQRLEQRPLMAQGVNAIQKSRRKGRKAKTAAKHMAIAKKKSMTKKAKKPASNQAKSKQWGGAHSMFLRFAKSVVLKGTTRNLCNPHTLLSAEKAVARLHKALANATA